MENKVIYWFDTDNTLWKTNAKVWIIDKLNPSKPIIKILQHEAALVLNGTYSNANLNIHCNGKSGWLNQEIFNNIQRVKNIELENIGISFREFINPKIEVEQSDKLINYINNIGKLADNRCVNFITSRSNKNNYLDLIKDLKQTLSEKDIELNDVIFVNDNTDTNIVGSNEEKKMITILKHITGYELKNDEFVPLIVEKYNTSYFYDDEDDTINKCIDINLWLKKYLDNTIIWLKERIEQSIKINKPQLILNKISTNEVNPYETTTIEIKILD